MRASAAGRDTYETENKKEKKPESHQAGRTTNIEYVTVSGQDVRVSVYVKTRGLRGAITGCPGRRAHGDAVNTMSAEGPHGHVRANLSSGRHGTTDRCGAGWPEPGGASIIAVRYVGSGAGEGAWMGRRAPAKHPRACCVRVPESSRSGGGPNLIINSSSRAGRGDAATSSGGFPMELCAPGTARLAANSNS